MMMMNAEMFTWLREQQYTCPGRIRMTNRCWRDWRLLFLCAIVLVAAPRDSQATPTGNNDNNNNVIKHNNAPFVLCRLTTEDTLFQDDGTGRFYGKEEIVCDAHNDGLDDLYHIPSLPAWLANKFKQGNTWVNITSAVVDKMTQLVVTNPVLSTFTVVPEPQDVGGRRRRLQRKAYSDAKGVRTYAIIRIATTDVQPSFTEQAMRARFTNPAVGMQAQYAACSANQLDFQLQGIYSVNLPKSMAEYGSEPSTLRNEAASQLANQLGIASVQDLADNVLFCIPPGTGGWVANAGTFYWRSQFNGEWCMSLTAVVVSVQNFLLLSLILNHDYL